jgi:hypothetical protein
MVIHPNENISNYDEGINIQLPNALAQGAHADNRLRANKELLMAIQSLNTYCNHHQYHIIVV